MVSIIVPVYNAKKYLNRCIDSILIQSYSDLEVILIDDGSYDGSSDICDDYAIKDNRIRVFHQENQGIGMTRQFGLEVCTGDFVSWVDADDWIDVNTIECLTYEMQKRETTDVIICDYWGEDNNGSHYTKEKINGFDTNQLIKSTLASGTLSPCLWNKFFRKEIIKKVSFESSIQYYEDLVFMCRLYKLTNNICHLNQAFYHYNYSNPTNLTNIIDKNKLLLKSQAIDLIKEEFANDCEVIDFYDLKKGFLFSSFMSRNFIFLNKYHEIHPKIIKEGSPYSLSFPIKSNFALALRGYPRIAYALMKLDYFLINTSEKVKRTISITLKFFH